MLAGIDRQCDRCKHERDSRPSGHLRQNASRTARSKSCLAALPPKCRGNVAAGSTLQQNDNDDEETDQDMDGCDQIDHLGLFFLKKIFRLRWLGSDEIVVRKGGFEPPRLSAPPPQDGVSASSTTSARIETSSAEQHLDYSKVATCVRQSPSRIDRGAQMFGIVTALMSSFRDLRHEFRPTLRLALPLVLAEIGWMSMGVVDTIMVGRLPNSAVAIGATGLGQSLYNIVGIFGAGLLLGLDTFVAQAHGREDMQDARHSLLNGFFLALALTPVLMLLISFWPALMNRFGVSSDLVEPMRPFLRALNWGTLPLLAYFALRRYLQAVNVVHPIMFALVSANVVNFVGNWALIYGHLGFPAMGITGSGWSTCFARIYMALVLLAALMYVESKRGLSQWVGEMGVDFRRMWQLLVLGAPAAAQILLEIGAFSGATALCAKLGAVPLSGHEIALTCASFTFMVPLGVSSAAAVRVGQEVGRGNPEKAHLAGWSAILLGTAFMACMGLLLVTFPLPIARIFSPDPVVVRFGARLLQVAAAFQLFDGLQTVATGALRGSGDTRTPMFANLVAYWFIGLPVGALLCFYFGWGALGIWIGLCVGLILIGTALLWTWHTRLRTESLASKIAA
jgi:multidrug resistance protein, MATE family